MPYFQVFLHGGIMAGLEVSAHGVITNAAPPLTKSIGMRFGKVNAWVRSKGGEIHPAKNPSELERGVWLKELYKVT